TPVRLAQISNFQKSGSENELKSVGDLRSLRDMVKISIERDCFISLKDIRTVIYSSSLPLIKIY
ncbi:MAG TPA: hypothetical protein VFM18_13255, partial [Methanosarcina sp.]|nr:hypothetical protein [Methanosarcina sp.]